ncbi:MAG: methyltransferase domain-containing protein [Myxococcales bacterium]
MLQSPYRWVPVLSDVYRTGFRHAAKLRYAGSRVECPICERTFSRFLGNHSVGNCPFCGSASRHRLLKLSLANEWSRFPPFVDVLHFAPEWGAERRFRKDARVRRYVTADLGAPKVDVRCDITAIDLPDASFDVVICCHVLEHVPDDQRAVRELHRVLRPGGIAYIQVPYASDQRTDEDLSVTDPRERARRFGQFDHVRSYGHDLLARLRAPGFRVDELRPQRSMDAEDARRWGLWDDCIFRCVKARPDHERPRKPV